MAHLAHAAVMQIVDPLRVRATPLRLQVGRAYTMKLHAQGGTPPYRWRVASGRPPRGFHLLADGTLVTTGAARAHGDVHARGHRRRRHDGEPASPRALTTS